MAVEFTSGYSPWQITWDNGNPVLVEIWKDGEKIVLGDRKHESVCASCGTPMLTVTPDNTEGEICSTCATNIFGR